MEVTAVYPEVEKYRTILYSIDEAFCLIEVMFDENGKPFDYKFLEINSAFELHTGLVEPIGKTAKYLVPELEQEWMDIYGEVALTGIPVRFQRYSRGTDRHYNLYAFRIGSDSSNLVAVLFTDITKQKKLEEQLIFRETQYRQTLDNLLEGCAIIGFDWTYIYINETNAKHAHMKPEEMTGRKMTDLIPHVMESSFYKAYKRCMEERTYQHIEDSFVFEDGSEQWFESFVHPVPEGIFILSMDITHRKTSEQILKRALKDLQESQAKLRESHKISKMGTAEYELTSGDIKMSEGVYDIFEIDKTKTRLNLSDISVLIHPDELEQLTKSLSVLPPEGVETEFRLLLPGNKIKHVEYHVKPLIDEAGNQDKRLGVIRDITERKLVELELNNTLQQLQEKIAEKEVLLRELYHRTKNNMQVISSLLNIRGSKITDENHRNSFLEMRDRIQAMSLVHERLYQTRNLSMLNIAPYIKDLVDLLIASHVEQKNRISVTYDLMDHKVPLNTAIPCGLIITELILNVVKYAFPDERKGKLRVSLTKADNDFNKLVICDDGIGIQRKVFEKSESLGIQIVTSLVQDQLNGEITLDNSKGTCWSIIFI